MVPICSDKISLQIPPLPLKLVLSEEVALLFESIINSWEILSDERICFSFDLITFYFAGITELGIAIIV